MIGESADLRADIELGFHRLEDELDAAIEAIEVRDEGMLLTAGPGKLNFIGLGVSCAVDPLDATQVNIFIPGPGGVASVGAPLGGLYACPAYVAAHDVVYLLSADTVDKASADDPSLQPVIGIVESKPSSTTALVYYAGELAGFTGLVAGQTYYVSSTAGQMTTTPPSASGDIVQRLGFAKSSSVFVILVDRDYVVLE